jgi:WS/DGAT/MGAT family acyltransferase
LGLDPPVWVDDASFDPAGHISVMRCGPPADRAAFLDIATDSLTSHLPRDRPLWRAVFVIGLDAGRVGLVLVLHHVLVDGIGGIALLTALVDDRNPPLPQTSSSHPLPTRDNLLDDVFTTRRRAVRNVPQGLARLLGARRELGLTRVQLAPRCSLNTPTGPARRVATVSTDLAQVRSLAHRHGATVNDVVLVAVTGAVNALLTDVGESIPELVVSVPVSARSATTAAELGNAVGVMPIRVPLGAPGGPDLEQVAALTRAQKSAARGSSALLIGPAFRALAALGVLRWFVERQRLVNSFLTDLRGPAQALTFAGVPVEEVVPITTTAGNVTVAFAAFSYAGALTIAVVVDPDRVPDVEFVTGALRARLRALGLKVAPDAC